MLTALVGPLILRTLEVWDYDMGSTQTTLRAYGEAMGGSARCLLDLGLNACWRNTASLRHFKMEIIAAFTENNAWRCYLSTCPSEAAAAATDGIAAVVELLNFPEIPTEETCKAFGVMSQVFRTLGFTRSNRSTHNPKLIPFSRRKDADLSTSSTGGFELSVMVADAYPSVVARLEHSSDIVREHALQTLGDFLPFMQPDSTSNEQRNLQIEGVSVGKEHSFDKISLTVVDAAR